MRGKPFDWNLLGAGIGELRAGEDAVEGVIVALGDGVELVIVATGTAEGQTEERPAGRLDRVLQREVPQLVRARRIAP